MKFVYVLLLSAIVWLGYLIINQSEVDSATAPGPQQTIPYIATDVPPESGLEPVSPSTLSGTKPLTSQASLAVDQSNLHPTAETFTTQEINGGRVYEVVYARSDGQWIKQSVTLKQQHDERISKRATKSTAPRGRRQVQALTLSDRSFGREVLNAKTPVLVDFTAKWCGPCKRLAPEIDKLAKQYGHRVKICKLDIDDNRKTARRYDIQSYPTVLFFQNGKVVKRIVGPSASSLKAEINRLSGD